MIQDDRIAGLHPQMVIGDQGCKLNQLAVSSHQSSPVTFSLTGQKNCTHFLGPAFSRAQLLGPKNFKAQGGFFVSLGHCLEFSFLYLASSIYIHPTLKVLGL